MLQSSGAANFTVDQSGINADPPARPGTPFPHAVPGERALKDANVLGQQGRNILHETIHDHLNVVAGARRHLITD